MGRLLPRPWTMRQQRGSVVRLSACGRRAWQAASLRPSGSLSQAISGQAAMIRAARPRVDGTLRLPSGVGWIRRKRRSRWLPEPHQRGRADHRATDRRGCAIADPGSEHAARTGYSSVRTCPAIDRRARPGGEAWSVTEAVTSGGHRAGLPGCRGGHKGLSARGQESVQPGSGSRARS